MMSKENQSNDDENEKGNKIKNEQSANYCRTLESLKSPIFLNHNNCSINFQIKIK